MPIITIQTLPTYSLPRRWNLNPGDQGLTSTSRVVCLPGICSPLKEVTLPSQPPCEGAVQMGERT